MCHQIAWRGTGDVDIMYPPMPLELSEAVRAVARRRHLGAGWMNDGPAQFAPYGRHVASRTLYTGEHLTVRAPDNRFLLGMKVHAAREDDAADTIWLMNDTGLHRRADLHDMAQVVSGSLGEVWKPSRVKKGSCGDAGENDDAALGKPGEFNDRQPAPATRRKLVQQTR